MTIFFSLYLLNLNKIASLATLGIAILQCHYFSKCKDLLIFLQKLEIVCNFAVVTSFNLFEINTTQATALAMVKLHIVYCRG